MYTHVCICSITHSVGDKPFEVKFTAKTGDRVRVFVRILDRKDGMYIVTYRLYETSVDIEISILRDEKLVGKSPYFMGGRFVEFTGVSIHVDLMSHNEI